MDLISHNEDLLKEILLRLPVKSVIRFKSVCKKWLSLISSDYFCHQHTLRRPQNPQPSLILEHANPWPDRNYLYCKPASINGGEKVMIPFTPSLNLADFLNNSYQIVHACNGLWLLMLDTFNIRDSYILYNPTTRLLREITPASHDEGQFVVSMALAFDPSKSPHYKVVCVISKLDSFEYLVEVYESESHSWKPSLGPFTILSGIDMGEANYYNNAIYWFCYCGQNCYCCFDIAKHEMKELPLPDSDLFWHVWAQPHLQELDGRLYYVILGNAGSDRHRLLVEVWEMGGDGNSEWLLKHHDDLFIYECIDDHEQPTFIFTFDGIGQCAKLMQGHSDGSLQLIYDSHSGNMKMRTWKMKMRAYNFLDKSFEDLVDFSFPPYNGTPEDLDKSFEDLMLHHTHNLLKAFQFKETLALV